MPPSASAPSGVLVLVLCGQPEQKYAGRIVPPAVSGRASRSRQPWACACTCASRMPSCSSTAAIARRTCGTVRSEEHTSELQSLMRISYAVFCLKKKTTTQRSPQSEYTTTDQTQRYTRSPNTQHNIDKHNTDTQ